MAYQQRQPLNRQQRRAEAKRNQAAIKREEQQKLERLNNKKLKDPLKAEKIEKKYKEYNPKKVFISFICIMLVFFIILGFILYPAVT
jgi:hypothetical protein